LATNNFVSVIPKKQRATRESNRNATTKINIS